MSALSEKLQELATAGIQIESSSAYRSWAARVEHFLKQAAGEEASREFNLPSQDTFRAWTENLAVQIGILEGLAFKSNDMEAKQPRYEIIRTNTPLLQSKKVFIVHGHDNEAKEKAARFLERIGLEPVILHEQANSGRTIIEKFEAHADVGFAVVLLTPDDVGGFSNASNDLKPRARQNVILELGYFIGRLSRQRVCALYKKEIEMPSDFQGVLYIELDGNGGWRTKLAQELVQVGYSINLEALLKS